LQHPTSFPLIGRNKSFVILLRQKEFCKGTTMARPGIQRVLTDAENGTMDVLLVSSSSRIGRNTIETLRFIRALGKFGVAVESVKEGALLDELLDFVENL
jgi:DNA invertase Pin-like site-specific DNA recombinase